MELGPRRQIVVDTYYGLEVVGIVVSEDRKFATIGTQTVQEGDIIEGTKIKVKTINPNSVEFEEDGKTWIQKTRERQEVEVGRK
jgi:type II secretory pathway component PulC